MRVWKPRALKPGQVLHWQIGPLKIWIRRTQDELHLAKERAVEDEETLVVGEAATESEEKLEWDRWVVGEADRAVQFVPVMPDRPVIVRPESDFIIPAGGEAAFFVSIPVWIRISIVGQKPVTLREVPTVVLSKSWFGGPASGELCYALKTKARRSLETLPIRPHRVICPVRNFAREELDFKRLCLHVEHLKIFGSKTHLWTNQVEVTYRGEEQLAQIDFADAAPAISDAKELISESRLPAVKGILRKSFSSLKAFSGI